MPLLDTGLGSEGMGEGPIGHDSEDRPSAVVTQTPVGAIFFEPFNRIYLRNADLTMLPSSAPIHRAAHLMLPLGSIPATPGSGIDVGAIKRASPLRRKRVIEDELRVAWRTLLVEGAIAIGKVTVEPSVPWSGRWDVEVKDLLTEESVRLANIPPPPKAPFQPVLITVPPPPAPAGNALLTEAGDVLVTEGGNALVGES